MKSRVKVAGGLFCFALFLVLYMMVMDDFCNDSVHKIRGRKHTLRISDNSWLNAIDDIVLCMIKKKQPLGSLVLI